VKTEFSASDIDHDILYEDHHGPARKSHPPGTMAKPPFQAVAQGIELL
jgi:hypothetical protein